MPASRRNLFTVSACDLSPIETTTKSMESKSFVFVGGDKLLGSYVGNVINLRDPRKLSVDYGMNIYIELIQNECFKGVIS